MPRRLNEGSSENRPRAGSPYATTSTTQVAAKVTSVARSRSCVTQYRPDHRNVVVKMRAKQAFPAMSRRPER